MENSTNIDIVTGAFSYSGKYITRRLLAEGRQVRTLTGHPERPNPFGGQVRVFPLDFERPEALVEAMQGATTLYNTYWVRFPHGSVTYERAIENTGTLIRAAKEAGIQRIVHISITNPAETSRLAYFRGKAILEREVRDSGLSYAIIRPTVVFGDEDVLINNIAWLLRHFPVFPIFGSGRYELQPIYVEDLARLVVEAGQRNVNEIIDAAGPDVLPFAKMVRLIARTLSRRVIFVHVSPKVGYRAAKLIEPLVGDVLITQDEIAGLMANLLISQQPPSGHTRLITWLQQHAGSVGKRYASELQRHYR